MYATVRTSRSCNVHHKVLSIVGARPQFIKAAVVSHEFESREDITEVLVHTGQHFDKNMSQTFFDELSIPEPRVNLGISEGTHAVMTARMLEALERVLLDEGPDAVLLYGDTNSTLAGALAAAKLHIPIAHVEAGARTRSMTNPEEINRICTDHVSSKLLACTRANLENLVNEGLGTRSEFVGDPMYDAFLNYSEVAEKPDLVRLDGESVAVPDEFYYLTCHREENTTDRSALFSILAAIEELDAPAVYPVHPRCKSAVSEIIAKEGLKNTRAIEPVGYLESLWLTNNAKQVITDSGGLQREAFFAEVKCTTILDFEVWPETMVDNRNLLARPSKESILKAMSLPQVIGKEYHPFGDGRASVRIADAVMNMGEVFHS